jgi:DNA (cytosine-5)-methyltransferase 1
VNEPTHLDVFSGIGGFALAARQAGFRTIGFCEIDKYCQKVIAKNFGAIVDDSKSGAMWNDGKNKRQTAGNEHSPGRTSLLLPNIFNLDGKQFRDVDLITGGFPCQPFSVAGKRRGAADDRAIWPEMFCVIKEARPAWVLGENVSGIIQMELDNVLSDLESIGYATRAFVIPACAVDARHRRDRIWIVAHAEISGLNGNGEQSETTRLAKRREISDTRRHSAARYERSERATRECCEWLPEPDVGRVAHGIPNRVDRLKGLGNAIVPQVAYEILREIRKLI